MQICPYCKEYKTSDWIESARCNSCFYWRDTVENIEIEVPTAQDNWTKRQRTAGKKAEILFETMLVYLKGKIKYKDWLKTGTSPHEHTLPYFYIYSYITLDPDYLLYANNRMFFIELKGTKMLKEADYLKLQELYERTKHFGDKAQVGIWYVNTKTGEQYWWTYLQVKEVWESIETTEVIKDRTGEVELDAYGNPKPYKIIPYDIKQPDIKTP